MECEYIEIMGVVPSRDPVNLYVYDSLDVVMTILRKEGFQETMAQFGGVLNGQKADVMLVKPLVDVGPLNVLAKEFSRVQP